MQGLLLFKNSIKFFFVFIVCWSGSTIPLSTFFFSHVLTNSVVLSISQLLTVNWFLSTYKHWVGKREWNHPFEIMISGKLFRQILDKFLVSPSAKCKSSSVST